MAFAPAVQEKRHHQTPANQHIAGTPTRFTSSDISQRQEPSIRSTSTRRSFSHPGAGLRQPACHTGNKAYRQPGKAHPDTQDYKDEPQLMHGRRKRERHGRAEERCRAGCGKQGGKCAFKKTPADAVATGGWPAGWTSRKAVGSQTGPARLKQKIHVTTTMAAMNQGFWN
ncbi:Uncharacterised protein [Leclercia adecarboxylata]|uniref:Uncharacterized protein n=1 Tax=Leclercia adecarboxylata TaxID=83655 RepID=A0A4U9HVV0_9ENTR|nr:Uncharacterised protein [Leclercia adecarboxylata]